LFAVRGGLRGRPFLFFAEARAAEKRSSEVSNNVIDEMRKQKRQQQSSDTANPEEKMLGQLWGIDFFLIHD
jgi:hypothetical protein